MNVKNLLTICGVAAAVMFGTSRGLAQNDNGGNGGNGGGNDNGGGWRQRGNFDPAQMQQRILERIQDQLGFTNDTEWDAVKPLVQKVLDARRDVGFGGLGRVFGGGRNRGGPGGPGGIFGQQSPEAEALQKAIDDNAPTAQIKDLLAKYKASQKAKQDKLDAAQADLKNVLDTKQEAQAALLGLVN
jgi:hypothetical protein